MKLCLIFLFLGMSISSLCHSQIYTWTDEKGRKQFSDQPPSNPEKSVSNITAKVSKPSVTRPSGTEFSIKESQRLKLRALLKQSQFDQLNLALNGLTLDYERGVINEDKFISSYKAFEFEFDNADTQFQSWINATPNSHQPYIAYGIYQFHMGWLERGHRWSSETDESQMNKFHNYLSKTHGNLTHALKLHLKSLITYFYLMRVMLSEGNHDEIAKLKDKALYLYPSSYHIRNVYLISLTPRWGGSFDELFSYIGEISNVIGKYPSLSPLQGMALLEAGDIESREKLYVSANELYTRSLEFGLNHSALYKRGKNQYRLKKYQAALVDLNTAISLYPEDPDYYYWRSKTLIALKNNPMAMQDINIAYALNPNDQGTAETRSWLAQRAVNTSINNSEKPKHLAEIITLTNALAKAPYNDRLLQSRARAHFKNGDLESALIDMKKAIQINPDEYDHYVFIDYVLFKQGNLDLIIDYWKAYIKRHPDSAKAYSEMAGTYSQKKDFQSAMKYSKMSADLGDSEGFIAYQKFKQILDNLANTH